MQLRRFAVIGHPIGHTMSPFIHDRLFSLTGHKPEYSVLDVPSLTQALPALRTLDGFNITIPHKSDIIPLLDSPYGTAWLRDETGHFRQVPLDPGENGPLQ